MTCNLMGPSSGDRIDSQLSTVMTVGAEAYGQAMDAMEALKATFLHKYEAVGVWMPGTPGVSTPVKSIEFIKPSPKPSATVEFSDYVIPEINEDRLADLGGILDSIIEKIGALLDDMPQFAGVSVEDRFISILDDRYTLLRTNLLAVLAETPIVASMADRLAELLEAGSVGMSADVEQALRDRGIADIDRALVRAEDEALGEWLARGFSLPGGVIDAKLSRVRQDAADKRAELSRDVLIEAAKWERENRQFAIQQGMAYQQQQTDIFLKLNEEARAVATTWQENHIKVALAAVEVYQAQVAAWGKVADALSVAGNAVATALKAELDALRIYLDRAEMLLKVDAQKVDATLRKFGADITLYQADVGAESSRIDTLLKLEGFDIQREKMASDLKMDEQKLELQKLLETSKITVEALSSLAKVSAQIASGAFSSLNMSASISNGTSNSNSCSESTTYSYDMT